MEEDLNRVQQQVRAINTQLQAGLVNANSARSSNKIKDGGCAFYVSGGSFVVEGSNNLNGPIVIDPNANAITNLSYINYNSVDELATRTYVREEMNREFNLDLYRKKDDLNYLNYYQRLDKDLTYDQWAGTHYITPVTLLATIKVQVWSANNDVLTWLVRVDDIEENGRYYKHKEDGDYREIWWWKADGRINVVDTRDMNNPKAIQFKIVSAKVDYYNDTIALQSWVKTYIDERLVQFKTEGK